jgi:hypothetical protein
MSKQAPESSAPEWPNATENRTLRCTLSGDELGAKSNEMARTQIDLCALEEQKKVVISEYSAREKEKKARINVLAQTISSKAEERQVPCEWRFEQSGIDAARQPIRHPEHKTLVRTDTGDVVEITRITDSDRQMALPLHPPEPVINGTEDGPDEPDEDENIL